MDTITPAAGENKTVLWIAGGCLAVLVCIAAAAFLGFGGLVWLGSQTADEATAALDVPATAQAGEPYTFRITVTNTSSEQIELYGVDISMNFLSGIAVESTDPVYTETSQFDSLGGGETYLTYYFHQAVAPGESLTVTFTGTAVTAGDFSGAMDVCINSDYNCITNVVRTVIR